MPVKIVICFTTVIKIYSIFVSNHIIKVDPILHTYLDFFFFWRSDVRFWNNNQINYRLYTGSSTNFVYTIILRTKIANYIIYFDYKLKIYIIIFGSFMVLFFEYFSNKWMKIHLGHTFKIKIKPLFRIYFNRLH